MRGVRLSITAFFILFFSALPAQKPVRVIVETDMGNDVDDVLAMDILYKAQDAKLINILGISSHKQSEYASQFIDVLNTWYGYKKIPIAKSNSCIANNEATDYTEAICKMKNQNGKAIFNCTKHSKDIEESVSFYRRLLSGQPDNSVVIISMGFAINLRLLLESEADRYSNLSGVQLVAKKVKYLSMMAGSFGNKKRAEFNVVNDIKSMQDVFDKWPTEIVLNPFELGKKIVYPATVIENNYKWTTFHPLVETYKAYKKMPYDRPTWDVLSAIYVIHPEMFTKSLSGDICVNSKGYTIYTPNIKGKHYVLSLTGNQPEEIKTFIVQTTTSKPLKHKTN